MEKTVKLIKETSYTQFLAQVDKCVESLPQFLQEDLKPILFEAWRKTVNTIGVNDTKEHIELFSQYALNLVSNKVYRDILLAILQNAWEVLV